LCMRSANEGNSEDAYRGFDKAGNIHGGRK